MPKDKFTHKMVIIVRKDLRMSKGKTAVRAAHAAVLAAENARKEKPIWYKNWYKEGQKKVVVQVPTMQELLELIEQAEWEDLPFSLVKDAGLTELPPGSTTVGAIGPAPYEKVDKITADLKLL